jgi:hypothetical protein
VKQPPKDSLNIAMTNTTQKHQRPNLSAVGVALEDLIGANRSYDVREPVYTGRRIYCHWCKHPLEDHGSIERPVSDEWEGDSGCTDLAGPLYGDDSDGLRDVCHCPYGPDGRIHRVQIHKK